LAVETGLAPDRLAEDALAGYVAELVQTREMLNGRYDELKSGRVKPVGGEAFFETPREREDELLNQRWPLGTAWSSSPRGPRH
jgi:hypothetical protein